MKRLKQTICGQFWIFVVDNFSIWFPDLAMGVNPQGVDGVGQGGGRYFLAYLCSAYASSFDMFVCMLLGATFKNNKKQ